MSRRPANLKATPGRSGKTIFVEPLHGAVGDPCQSAVLNNWIDVIRIQKMLNKLLWQHYLLPFSGQVQPSGRMDNYTLQLIQHFQKRIRISGPEANLIRLEPSGETLRKLTHIHHELENGVFDYTYKGEFRKDLFAEMYSINFRNALKPGAIPALKRFLVYLEQDPEVFDLRWMAYMMATTMKECGYTWLPITEKGGVRYFDKYNNSKKLGNGPNDGYLFRGRGFAQLTGREQYQTLGDALGVDLVNDPDRALEPDLAYKILSYGMRNGSYTKTTKLSDFISGTKCDFVNARRIVNGVDCAQEVAGYAQTLLSMLQQCRAYGK